MRTGYYFLVVCMLHSLVSLSNGGMQTTSKEHVANGTVVRLLLNEEECTFADKAEYGVFIPNGDTPVAGVLVLQHGCTMEQFGITKPYDLQYQAFAKKWNLAIIETALHGDCHVWKVPGSGSTAALKSVLAEAGKMTNHPKLGDAPWLIWGHSAGGYWTLAMLKEYPERIIAAVCYSAAGDPGWDYPESVSKIPVLLRHAGFNDGPPHIKCWATATNAFLKLRELNAPASIVHNEDQNHNYSYLRYMMIPFFESALQYRLEQKKRRWFQKSKKREYWLGDTLSMEIFKESEYRGNKRAMCQFLDKHTAEIWQEYVKTGTVIDKTPPPPPRNVTIKSDETYHTITWEADADIESGILKFNIFKNGTLIGSLPETGSYQTFDTNGDNTLPAVVPPMHYAVPNEGERDVTIGIQSVNHFNLVSDIIVEK